MKWKKEETITKAPGHPSRMKMCVLWFIVTIATQAADMAPIKATSDVYVTEHCISYSDPRCLSEHDAHESIHVQWFYGFRNTVI